jgi:hypothetical protein
VAVGAEKTMEESADAFAVVGNQHAAASHSRARVTHQHVLSMRRRGAVPRLHYRRPKKASLRPVCRLRALMSRVEPART